MPKFRRSVDLIYGNRIGQRVVGSAQRAGIRYRCDRVRDAGREAFLFRVARLYRGCPAFAISSLTRSSNCCLPKLGNGRPFTKYSGVALTFKTTASC